MNSEKLTKPIRVPYKIWAEIGQEHIKTEKEYGEIVTLAWKKYKENQKEKVIP